MKRGNTVQMSFYLDEILAKEFKSECALHGDTLRSVLVRAIEEYVKRKKKTPNS